MSTNYYFKIKKLAVVSKPVEQMVDLAYHSMQDNFRSGLKNCGLDLKKEPAKIKAPRLLELLKEIRDTQGIDALKKVGVFNWERFQEDWKKLRESYTNPTNLFHSYFLLVKNNLFYTAMGEEDKVLPVLMVNVEIISVHPDAGYPRYRMNASYTKGDERKFLLRILRDAIYGTNPESLLVKESNKPTRWDKTQTGTDYRMDASKIIWGFERHKGLKIKHSSNKSFWKKHAHQWWSDLRESYFYYKSDNHPFEQVTYDIMIHPGWEEELIPSLDKRIDSTAHWS